MKEKKFWAKIQDNSKKYNKNIAWLKMDTNKKETEIKELITAEKIQQKANKIKN